MEDVAVGLLPSSSALTLILSAVRSFSLQCAHFLCGVLILSAVRSFSQRCDGSLPAISPIGAEATVVCSSGVPTTSAAAELGAFFLPVKSLVRLFQNSIVV